MDNEYGPGNRSPMPNRNLSELEPVFAELESAVRDLRTDPDSDEAQCNVCLLTRSAYTDFYSVSVLQSEIDEWASKRLEALFTEALGALPEGKYRESVNGRLKDFEAFRMDIKDREPDDTAIPVA